MRKFTGFCAISEDSAGGSSDHALKTLVANQKLSSNYHQTFYHRDKQLERGAQHGTSAWSSRVGFFFFFFSFSFSQYGTYRMLPDGELMRSTFCSTTSGLPPIIVTKRNFFPLSFIPQRYDATTTLPSILPFDTFKTPVVVVGDNDDDVRSTPHLPPRLLWRPGYRRPAAHHDYTSVPIRPGLAVQARVGH